MLTYDVRFCSCPCPPEARQNKIDVIPRRGELEVLRLKRPPLTKRKNRTTRIVSNPNVPLATFIVLIRLRCTERHHKTIEIIKPRAVSLIKHGAYTRDKGNLFPVDLRAQILRATAAQIDGHIPRSTFDQTLQTPVALIGIQPVTHLRSNWVLVLRWTFLPFDRAISPPDTRQLFKWIAILMRQMEKSNGHKALLGGWRLVAAGIRQQGHKTDKPCARPALRGHRSGGR